MGKEYTGKSFKSGNSVAIRMPAALGVEPDLEWLIVRDENGDLIIRSKPKAKRKFNIDKVWGIGRDLGLKPLSLEDRVFEERKLLWDDPEWQPGTASNDGGNS